MLPKTSFSLGFGDSTIVVPDGVKWHIHHISLINVTGNYAVDQHIAFRIQPQPSILHFMIVGMVPAGQSATNHMVNLVAPSGTIIGVGGLGGAIDQRLAIHYEEEPMP